MAFVLIATSTGDDLIPSKDTVVAESRSREKLETLREDRARQRAAALKKHPLPWWARECIISNERIEEIPSV